MTDPDLDRMWLLTEEHRWTDAVEAARAHLREHPESAYAFKTLAYSQIYLSRLEEAWSAALEACRLGPNDAWNFMVRSQVASARRNGKEAVESAQEAVRLAPTSADAHSQLADAFLTHLGGLGTRHYEPASSLGPALQALRLDPNSVRARDTYAHALRALGRSSEAVKAYREVLAIDPVRASAIAGLGTSYGERHPFQAIRHLTAALALQPNAESAQVNISWVLYRWTRRLVYICVAGGLVVAVARLAVAPWLGGVVTAGLIASCLVASVSLLRLIPPRALVGLWAQTRYPTRICLGLLLVTVVALVVLAVALAYAALGAVVVLALVALTMWKGRLAVAEQRLRAWAGRARRLFTA